LNYAFPFFGVVQLKKAIKKPQTMDIIQADKRNARNVGNLLTKVYHSHSFGDTRACTITDIIMTISFDLLIVTYDVVLKKESSLPHEFKEMVENITLERTEKILEKTLGNDKLGNLLKYWDKIQKHTNHFESFVPLFEGRLIKLVQCSALDHLERFIETTTQFDLFVSRESKKKLLHAIASSRHNNGLFIILADLQGFRETINSLDPLIFKEWYNNNFDFEADKDIKEVCQKLNKILSLKGNIAKKEVVKIAQDILKTELKTWTVGSILRETDTFGKYLSQSVLVETFMHHVSKEISDARSDVFKLLEPFTVNGILRIETR
jgi:hypothetical protein